MVRTTDALGMSIELKDASETRSLGIQLGRVLPAGTVLLLQGDLGSGKTSLVQGIGEGLGIRDSIESPTFTLINEYLTGRIPLYHFDLYRLEPEQTATLYPEIYWDGVEVEPGICAIEWSERLQFKPESYLEILLSYQDTGRRVEISAIGDAVIPELRIGT
ncbi:MAG: tRNA (adenosine(37)-N6)-threonylcarbamoyltransferase complex ATPase subunit type 1 TsaE [Leptolyngbya sp. Prado105]|jgi:tRNA threonylcarbamoyladenosine biosynthesis protein TsaE|nr:tRNA (adenosine(37)-N6)-threonylcarbamoyltransferase complex ATPase subunit type 1 TsaE [Leptolyngbya sp. Prado105]